MDTDRDKNPRTAEEVRHQEKEHQPERTADSQVRHPNDPIGGAAFSGDMMLPPTGNLYDPTPSTGMPGEPPHGETEDEEPR